jgi:hypothetical protein
MLRRKHIFAWTLFVACTAAGVTARADGVLDNVPRDAVGLVYLRDPQALDKKLVSIVQRSNVRNPIVVTPQIILQVTLGQDAGVHTSGEFLLAILPSERPLDNPPLCAWVPVSDYQRFASALKGNPEERVTAVTVMGEDLLCAHHGRWALLMDPDQRERMHDLLAGSADPPPQLDAWRDWLARQDAVVVVLPTEMTSQALRNWLSTAPPAGPLTIENWMQQDGASRPSNDFLSTVRRSVHQVLASSPKLSDLLTQVDTAALGARIGDKGELVAGVRLAWPEAARVSENGGFAVSTDPPPSLPTAGPFVVSGGGRLPPAIMLAVADAYARLTARELKGEWRTSFDADALAQFAASCEQAAGDVRALSLLQALGPEREGVYTNQFLAVRVASASQFVDRVATIVRRWNVLNRSAEQSTGLEFESVPVVVAGQPATQFSLDIMSASGVPEGPEVRQLMEKLFGPGGKLLIHVVPVDERTVLVAAATPDQTASALKALRDGATLAWAESNVAAANQLLAEQADWRCFFNVSNFLTWRKQETDATLGHVIGGPKTLAMPDSPPLGAAGGFRGRELWIDAVVPAATAQAAAALLKSE